jgi:hypothetical protein
MPTCPKLTFMQNMMQQISGNADVTTSHDGILITKHGEGTDLIDKAIANNGQIPDTALQPVIQRAPARAPLTQPTPNGTAPAQANPAATPRPRLTATPTPKP